jgi:citrate lyase subunit beta/citryl-CoA lyase
MNGSVCLAAEAVPIWRSILYVPANVTRFVESASRRGADAVQLDLEDSVPPAEKDSARNGLAHAIEHIARSGVDVLVRVNSPLSLAVRDIEAAVSAEVRALTLSKIDGVSHVRLLDELVSECEARKGLPVGRTKFLLLIESARAFAAMREIATASPRVLAMGIGGEDFALDCGFDANDETLLAPKQQLVIAARAAGVLPMGYLGSVTQLADEASFRSMVRRSRRFGFEMATCVHPRQVAIVNDEYGVRSEELALAQRVIEANADNESRGIGAFRLEGKLIDKPVVDRARRVVARHEAFERRLKPEVSIL